MLTIFRKTYDEEEQDTIISENPTQLVNTLHLFKDYCDGRQVGTTDIYLKHSGHVITYGYGFLYGERSSMDSETLEYLRDTYDDHIFQHQIDIFSDD